MLRLRRRAFRVDGEAPPARLLSAALYAATTCEETTLPWPRTAPADPDVRRRQAALALGALPEASFSPFDRGTVLRTDLLALCAGWPAAGPAAPPGPGPLPNVPVLLLEGEDDLRTPVEGARRVAALFPQARLVISAATGHSALGSDPTVCARRAFDRFFRGGQVPSRCPRVRRFFTPQPPAPTPAGARDSAARRARRPRAHARDGGPHPARRARGRGDGADLRARRPRPGPWRRSAPRHLPHRRRRDARAARPGLRAGGEAEREDHAGSANDASAACCGSPAPRRRPGGCA